MLPVPAHNRGRTRATTSRSPTPPPRGPARLTSWSKNCVGHYGLLLDGGQSHRCSPRGGRPSTLLSRTPEVVGSSAPSDPLEIGIPSRQGRGRDSSSGSEWLHLRREPQLTVQPWTPGRRLVEEWQLNLPWRRREGRHLDPVRGKVFEGPGGAGVLSQGRETIALRSESSDRDKGFEKERGRLAL